MKIGPVTTPWVASGALSIDGVRYRLGGIGRMRQTKIAETFTGCEFSLRGQDIAVDGRISAEPARFVGWVYADPSGPSHHVLHSSLGEITLRVTRPSKPSPPLELRSRGATYELGLRPAEHGVPIQPHEDG